MKKAALFFLLIAVVFAASAQTQVSTVKNSEEEGIKIPSLDKSPLDISYFPADYPLLKTKNKTSEPPVARVIYSRPQINNRLVFGGLVEYDKVWRLGANESTEIEFFKEVSIGGKKVPKGRYTLYAIPTPATWTIILNTDKHGWGAFIYDEKKDVVRTEVPVNNLTVPVEPFSISFDETKSGADLVIAWEKVSVRVPIEEYP